MASKFGLNVLLQGDDDDIDLQALEQEVQASSTRVTSFKLDDAKASTGSDLVIPPAPPSGLGDYFQQRDTPGLDARSTAPQINNSPLDTSNLTGGDGAEQPVASLRQRNVLDGISKLEPLDKDMWESQELYHKTKEEEKTRVAHNVLRNLEPVAEGFDTTQIDDEDQRIILMEEIEELLDALKNDNVDVSRIPIPTNNTTIAELQTIQRRLRIKNDKLRNQALGEEGILALAHGLEYMFDGEKEYFGRHPDLTDWSDTVQVKMRRLRPNTGALVGNIVNTGNISPGLRILLELVPSAFLYSRLKKEKQNDNIYNSAEVNNEINIIRSVHNT